MTGKSVFGISLSTAVIVVAVAVDAIAGLTAIGTGTVEFEAVGPAGMKIDGVSNGVTAAESAGQITITSPTTEFHTGIGLRDRHLKEYLESEKHPSAQLVIDRTKIALPQSSAPVASTLTAPLTLHGVTKPVTVAYRIVQDGSAYKVHGDVAFDLQDFEIKKPCYLGVCVGDHVKVKADFSVHAN
ncbi:MAG TPA: YceI family protein [Polyangiaceae bacterium]|jgi:polyisoprenoid-binding protein YceI|nr:YceI family protein [Polyangiaceae bacterium]